MNLLAYYAEHQERVEPVEIANKNFKIVKLPAFDAMKLLHKVVKLSTPLLAVLSRVNVKKDKEGKFDVDFSKLDFAELDFDDDLLSELIKKVVEMCQIDGRMILFDMDMTDLKMPYQLAFAFLKLNYADFFLDSLMMKKVVKSAEGLDLNKLKK